MHAVLAIIDISNSGSCGPTGTVAAETVVLIRLPVVTASCNHCRYYCRYYCNGKLFQDPIFYFHILT
jgi:hypothetical protein